MDPSESFRREVENNVASLAGDRELRGLTQEWIDRAAGHKYTYNFRWMGRPIIQLPQDMVAIQEIVWQLRPQVIVETGVAHGGSLIFSASLLELLGGTGTVVGVDIEIRKHNRLAIESHPLARRIRLVEGSSTDPSVIAKVFELAARLQPAMVILDSCHTHQHVLQELGLYSPLVRIGGYIVVLDTIIEDMPVSSFSDRPWGKGNNPKTAVWEFLRANDRFVIDKDIENKLLITAAPDGYLKCVRD